MWGGHLPPTLTLLFSHVQRYCFCTLLRCFFQKKILKISSFIKKTALWHQRSNTIVPKNCGRWKFGFGLLIAFHDRK